MVILQREIQTPSRRSTETKGSETVEGKRISGISIQVAGTGEGPTGEPGITIEGQMPVGAMGTIIEAPSFGLRFLF